MKGSSEEERGEESRREDFACTFSCAHIFRITYIYPFYIKVHIEKDNLENSVTRLVYELNFVKLWSGKIFSGNYQLHFTHNDLEEVS